MVISQMDPHDTPHLFGKWRLKALFVIMILALIGYALFSLWAGWEKVAEALELMGWKGLLAPLCLSTTAYFFRFGRWTLFLKALGHKLPFLDSLKIYIGGFAFSVTPGKTGEALRGVFLKDYGIPYKQSLGAFFAERFSDMMSVIVLASGGLLCCPQTRSLTFAGVSLVLLILLSIQSEKVVAFLEKGAKKVLPDRWAEHVEFVLEIILSFKKCFSVPMLLVAIGIGVCAWGLEAVGGYTLLHLAGAEIGLYEMSFIYGFSLLVGALTFLPAGLGGAEVTLIQLLILYDVPPSLAVAGTVLLRLTTLWWSVFLGLVALPRKWLQFE
jgi:uncharacterized protein (TIRG00374 family)